MFAFLPNIFSGEFLTLTLLVGAVLTAALLMVRPTSNQRVELNAGSLFVIALIVFSCGGGCGNRGYQAPDLSPLRNEVSQLRNEVKGLKGAVDHQTKQLDQLLKEVKPLEKKIDPPRQREGAKE